MSPRVEGAGHESATGATRRLFVAIPIPGDVRDRLASVVEQVRAVVAVDPGPPPVRWVRLDGLHLTLRFLGATREPLVPAVVAAVRTAVQAVGPFEAAIGGAGAFPSGARPRALWIGVLTGGERLEQLAEAVDGALAAAGWDRETRPFRAHLTLARSDGVRAGPATVTALQAATAGLRLPWTIDQVVVYESLIGHGPARYQPVARVPLGG